MLTIRPEYNRGILEGDVTPEIESLLSSKFMWIDPDDLNNRVYFYADGAMYLGIVHELSRYLKDNGVKCTVEMPEVTPARDRGWEFYWEFRKRQDVMVDIAIDKRFCMLQAPPGFGKTVAMVAITARLGLPTVILTNAAEPFRQAYNTFINATNIKPGRVGDKHMTVRDVTVCTVQTVARIFQEDPDGELATRIKSAKVVMVDECHHAAAGTFISVISEFYDPNYMLGFSATPEDREDGLQDFVNAFLGSVEFRLTYGQQIDDGTAVPISVWIETIPKRDFGYAGQRGLPQVVRKRQYQLVYDAYVINNEFRNRAALVFADEMLNDGHTVALIVSRVEHIVELQRLDKRVVALHAKTKNRDDIIHKLRHHEITLVATTLFDEATDIPSLGAVALLAGGKSKIKLKQRLRCTRIFDGMTAKGRYTKDRGYVWMPYDNADFLTPHSVATKRLLKDIVSEHPDNELYTL